MNVLQIVKDHLKKTGAEGLCHADTECGCELSDLAPCGAVKDECVPAMKAIHCGKAECECNYCDNGNDFTMIECAPLKCKQCGGDAEEARRCYATPVCFSCLPPPRPLKKIEWPNGPRKL